VIRSKGAQQILEEFTKFILSSKNPRLNSAKLKLLEKFGKLINIEKSFRRMSKKLYNSLLVLEISFTELEIKKEEKEKRKQEDYEMLKKLKMKMKLTFKQEQITKSRGFHARLRKDKTKPKDKETIQIEKKIAKRNKQKKTQKFNKRLLETYYALILKIIRLHYKKPIIAVGLKGLMRFINRMPAKFVGQILINLRSIFKLMEEDQSSEGSLLRKLKVIRTMLSLWKKINFEDHLENHFLQNKLYQCFLEVMESDAIEGEVSEDLLEDLYVNFDNLVMKVRVSDSNAVCNWFILLYCLAVRINNSSMTNINLYLMNKMTEKYEKLVYYMDDELQNQKPIRPARDLTMTEDKNISLKNTLMTLKNSLGGNNRGKYLIECLLEKKLMGKKYIGMDLRGFLKIA
jgi:hypothetical protein